MPNNESQSAGTIAPPLDALELESERDSLGDGSSLGGSESTSSGEKNPIATAVRTAARQLGTHIPGPRDVDNVHRGRTKQATRALQQSESAGLIAMLGPSEGGRVVHALVAERVIEPDGPPKCTIAEAEPEPTSFPAACTSKYADVWKKSMDSEFEGLVAAGTFSEVKEVPEGCNVVDSKWMGVQVEV